MRLPHITKNVTLDIVQEPGFNGPPRIVARCTFDGKRFAQCFTAHPNEPDYHARHQLDGLARQIGRYIVFGECGE